MTTKQKASLKILLNRRIAELRDDLRFGILEDECLQSVLIKELTHLRTLRRTTCVCACKEYWDYDPLRFRVF